MAPEMVGRVHSGLHSRTGLFTNTIINLSQNDSRLPVLIPTCATCHKPQNELAKPLKRCAKCHITNYCTPTCQKKDWKDHKRVCNKPHLQTPESSATSSSKVSVSPAISKPFRLSQGITYPASSIEPVALEELLEFWEILKTNYPPELETMFPHQLHEQAIDLCCQINSSKFPDLSITNLVAREVGIHPEDVSTKFHVFAYEMCMAYALALRLDKIGWNYLNAVEGEDNYARCVTSKVLAAMHLSREWIPNITATDPPPVFPAFGHTLRCSSEAVTKQVEGLLEFAKVLQWPWFDELEEYTKTIPVTYPNYLRFQGVGPQPYEWDWLLSLTLPGKFFACKIMLVLVVACESTRHLGDNILVHPTYLGLLLGQQSYWRQSSPVGKVMGGLKGAKSSSGWIGPCVGTENGKTAGFLAAPDGDPESFPSFAWLGKSDGKFHLGPLVIRPDESEEDYFKDLEDWTKYVAPEPPAISKSMCKLLHISFTAPSQEMIPGEAFISEELHLIFEMNNGKKINYQIKSNPLFISAIPCVDGPHMIHPRQLLDHSNFWEVDNLKSAPDPITGGRRMIINATCGDGEVLARAWCAERGVHAVVRRKGVTDMCLTCAVRMADVGVLIWS